MDCEVADVQLSGGAYIDAHGFDERRVVCTRVAGTGGIVYGNAAWPEGGNQHAIRQSSVSFVYLGRNAQATIQDSVVDHPGDLTLRLEPGSRLEATQTTFRGSARFLGGTGQFDGQFKASNCVFEETGSGGIIRFTNGGYGGFDIRESLFLSSSWFEPIIASGNISVTLRNNRFEPLNPWANNNGAVWLNGHTGDAEIAGNELVTSDSTAWFLWRSGSPIPSYNAPR